MMPLCYHKFPDWPVALLCPISMASARMDDIMIQTGGCGRDGLEDKAIPDSGWGLDFKPSCRVHDWMIQQAKENYRRHKDEARLVAEERFADSALAFNLINSANQLTKSKLLRWLRLRRIYKYVDAVSIVDVLSALPEETLVAMGYGSATEAMEGIC